MDLVTAHGMLADLPVEDRPDLGCTCVLIGVDCWPAIATALASETGWLEEVPQAGAKQLLDCVEHGASLLSAEIIDEVEVNQATQRVIAEVLLWGQQVEEAAESGRGKRG